jgi:hypothetical protein
MRAFLQRLERGERCWPAEIGLRCAGAVLLAVGAILARALHRLVLEPPLHQPRPAECAVALIVLGCLSSGMALAAEGPGLFRLVPRPPKSFLP